MSIPPWISTSEMWDANYGGLKNKEWGQFTKNVKYARIWACTIRRETNRDTQMRSLDEFDVRLGRHEHLSPSNSQCGEIFNRFVIDFIISGKCEVETEEGIPVASKMDIAQIALHLATGWIESRIAPSWCFEVVCHQATGTGIVLLPTWWGGSHVFDDEGRHIVRLTISRCEMGCRMVWTGKNGQSIHDIQRLHRPARMSYLTSILTRQLNILIKVLQSRTNEEPYRCW